MTFDRRIRHDLTALRAVAVLLVVCVHAFGVPIGGWVGVDVFFALSGYLLARSMVSERVRTGRFALGGFLRRRFWRLFPAAVLTLAVVAIGAVVALRQPLAASVLRDSGAAALGIVNWVFLGRDADYWASASSTSPLQHFWSLSVELQFYVVFPLLVAVLWRSLRRPDAVSVRRIAVAASVLVLVASVAWAASAGTTAPAASYFDTGSRLWELAAGAALGALSVPVGARTQRVPARIRVGGVLSGLGIIGVAALTAPGADAVPVPDAVLAVVGTIVVLVSGQGLPALPVLRWRPVQWVGEASYSIYLWHFPAIVAAAYVFPEQRAVAGSAAVLVGLVLGGLSRRWVELPAMRVGRRPGATVRVVASVASFAVVAFGTGTLTAAPTPQTERVGDGVASAVAEPWTPRSLGAALGNGLRSERWPVGLTPALDELVPGPPQGYEACDRTVIGDPGSCRFAADDPVRQVTVVGSSVGVALMPAAVGAFGHDSIVRGLTASGCPMLDIAVRGKSDDDRRRCNEQRAAAIDEINETTPDIVVVTHGYDGVAQLVGRPSLPEAAREWEAAAGRFVDAVAGSGARVVFVAAVPQGGDPSQCAALRLNGPDACTTELSDAYQLGAAAERRVAESRAGVDFVDSSGWYCVDGRCPVLADDVLIRKDGQHITREFSERLAVVLREAVLAER